MRYRATGSAALTERFLAAASSGDLAALEELLVDDVRTWMDAGPTSSHSGQRRASGRLAAFAATARCVVAEVNGGAGVVFLRAE